MKRIKNIILIGFFNVAMMFSVIGQTQHGSMTVYTNLDYSYEDVCKGNRQVILFVNTDGISTSYVEYETSTDQVNWQYLTENGGGLYTITVDFQENTYFRAKIFESSPPYNYYISSSFEVKLKDVYVTPGAIYDYDATYEGGNNNKCPGEDKFVDNQISAVSSIGSTITYQWRLQSNVSDVTYNVNNSSYNFTVGNVDYYNVFRIATESCVGASATKFYAFDVYNKTPTGGTIGIENSSTAVCENTTRKIENVASPYSDGASYKWVVAGLTKNENTDYYNLDVTGKDNISVKRVVTDYCGNTANSNTITVDVDYIEPGKISWSSSELQAEDTVCENVKSNNIQLPSGYATAQGGGTFMNYFWQRHYDGTSWENVSGANLNIFIPSEVTSEKTWYRRGFQTECGTKYSNEITIETIEDLNPGTIYMADPTTCYNAAPGLITNSQNQSYPSDRGVYYNFQKFNGSIWSGVTSGNNLTYQPPALTSNATYRRIVKDAHKCEAYSNTQTISVYGDLEGGEISALNGIACKGSIPEQITSSASPTGGKGTNTYKWQYRNDGSSTWVDITNNKSYFTFTAPLTNSRYYRRVVTNDCGTAYSNEVFMQYIGFNLTVGDASACKGDALRAYAPAGYSGYSFNSGITVTENYYDIPQVNNDMVVHATVFDEHGCSASDDFTVFALPLPTYDITDKLLCKGESITLSGPADMSSYLWSTGSTFRDLTLNPSSNLSLNLKVTNSNGCSYTDNVNINLVDTPYFSLANKAICKGTSTWLTAPFGYSRYVWKKDGVVIIDDNSSYNILVSPQSTSIYSLTAYNANGCEGFAQMTLTVYENPSISLNDTSACYNTSINLRGPDGYPEYYWSNNGGLNQVNTTVAVNSNIELRLTVKDGHGCSGTDTIQITSLSLPSFNITNKQVCKGLTLDVDGPDNMDGYLWSNGQTIKTATFSSGSNQDVTLRVTDNNGCQYTDAFSIAVVDTPYFNLTDESICYGDNISINSLAGLNRYVWKKDGVTIIDDNSTNTLSVSPSSTSVYSLSATNSNGCIGYDQMTLTVYNNPEISIKDTSACINSTVNLSGPDNFLEYYWSNGSGMNQKETTVTVTDTVFLHLTVVDANGCEGSDSMYVYALENPSFELTDTSACTNEYITLHGPTLPYKKYKWSTGDTTKDITWKTSTIKPTATLTVWDNYNCSGSDVVYIDANPLPSGFDIADKEACKNDMANFTAKSNYTSYKWFNGATTESISVLADTNKTMYLKVSNIYGCYDSTFFNMYVYDKPEFSLKDTFKCNDGKSISLNGPQNMDEFNWSTGANTQSILVNPTTSTSYSLTVKKYICSATQTIAVEVYSLPSIVFADTSACQGDSIELNSPGIFDGYLWSNGKTTDKIKVKPTVFNNNFSLTVTDANGCKNSDNVTVAINSNPNILLDDVSICRGNGYTMSVPSIYYLYDWSNGAITSSTTVSPDSTTKYFVNVTDYNGCSTYDSLTVTVNSNPVVTLRDTATCKDVPVRITYKTGMKSYNWSTGHNTNEILFKPDNTVNIQLVVTDNNNCAGSGTMKVTVYEKPNVKLPSVDVCKGDTAFIPGPDDFISYLWSTGEKTKDIKKVVSTDTYYSLQVIDSNNCSATAGMTVYTIPLPFFTMQDVTVCLGENANLSAPFGFDKYKWSTGDTVKNISVKTIENKVYNLQVTNVQGCKNSANVNVFVNGLPVFDIANFSMCEGASKLVSGPSGNYSYSWDNGNISKYNTIKALKTDTFSLQIKDMYTLCSFKDSFIVEAIKKPVFDFNDTLICKGEPVSLTALSGTYTYTWSTGAKSQTVNLTPSTTTDYFLTINDPNNCYYTDSFRINVQIPQNLTIGNSIVLCDNLPQELYIPGSYDEFNWSTGDSTNTILLAFKKDTSINVELVKGVCETYKEFNITVNPSYVLSLNDTTIYQGDLIAYNLDGEFNSVKWSTGYEGNSLSINPESDTVVSVIVETKFGCYSSDTANIKTKGLDFFASGIIKSCENTQLTINVPDSLSFISWADGSLNSTLTLNTLKDTTLKAQVYNSLNERGRYSILVDVDEFPIFTGYDKDVCDGDSLRFSMPVGISYTWSNGIKGNEVIIKSVDLENLSVGMVTHLGCTKSYDFDFNVMKYDLDFYKTEKGDSIILTPQSDAELIEYTWTIDGKTYTDKFCKLKIPVTNGQYDVSLSAVSSNGCIKSLTKEDFIKVSGSGKTGINQSGISNVTVYPVPAKDALYINAGQYAAGNKIYVELFNTGGEKVISNIVDNSVENEINIQGLPPGLYLLKMNINGSVKSQKIIIQN